MDILTLLTTETCSRMTLIMKFQKKQKKRETPQSSSDILLKVANDKELKDNLTYKILIHALGRRSFGIAILLFALPSALPLSAIPGFSIIFSIPLCLFGMQLLFAKKTLWLPKFIAKRNLSHKKLAKVIKVGLPYLKKTERLFKPRWFMFTNQISESICGLLITGLAITLMLPIPFTNFIIAMVIAVLALGIVEEDGLMIFLGWLATLLVLIFIPTFIVALVKKLLLML